MGVTCRAWWCVEGVHSVLVIYSNNDNNDNKNNDNDNNNNHNNNNHSNNIIVMRRSYLLLHERN